MEFLTDISHDVFPTVMRQCINNGCDVCREERVLRDLYDFFEAPRGCVEKIKSSHSQGYSAQLCWKGDSGTGVFM